jgi:hypothetical protein
MPLCGDTVAGTGCPTSGQPENRHSNRYVFIAPESVFPLRCTLSESVLKEAIAYCAAMASKK